MNGLPAFISEPLQRLFLKEMLSTPRGQATLLKQLGDAEGGDGGELDIFGHILAVLDDDEVKKLVRVHAADEVRHERLYLDRAKATGAQPLQMPREAHLLQRIDAKLGFFSKPIVDRQGVARAYMLLLVIEERATTTFDRYMRVFESVGDTETAKMIGEIKKDEERHLRYCEAISKRYCDNEDERQRTLAEYRALEAKCFDEVQAINLRALVAEGFVGRTWWTKALWSALAGAAEKRLPLEMRASMAATA